ncbi:phosphatidylserine decarboxylase-domain-containing protein [Aspergillus leporis]|uniref:Phosphatidylserine decarboxylase-domain-containing protein n=1 Tax=Aspergillus leporis TaxID=41062 RepID=A0A5N5WT41_9EURO|nr:phosphatidylserine decarboxylase-domain-containing protein [Aspergillus leporis]
MATTSSFAVFLNQDVNVMLKKLLKKWARFLNSSKSAVVLYDSEADWLSPSALEKLANAAQGRGSREKFHELFDCEPNAELYGFQSWDEFFTRRFRDGIRPVASPDDDGVITNACESQPTNLTRGVKACDSFWIKGKGYSLSDMLGEEFSEPFIGGTVYQGYLDIFKYHRWHAPVSGKIVKTCIVDGTHFSTPQSIRTDVSSDESGSIAYYYPLSLAIMAPRAVILIEADNPDIGLMAFFGVGIDEMSSCEITVEEGGHVRKGDQLGMFHYGGSSHCLIFRKGVKVTSFPAIGRKENVPVRSQVAVLES